MGASAESRPGSAPIYDSLVAEHGDVLNQSRLVAEATQKEAADALNWHAPRPFRDEAAG